MTNEQMQYTDEMRQLSGFGGGYEEACRRMALAGARYLIEYLDDETYAKWQADKTRVWEKDPIYVAFEKVVGEAEEGCSGAMHGAACSHAFNIRYMGWDAYKQKMIELKQAEG